MFLRSVFHHDCAKGTAHSQSSDSVNKHSCVFQKMEPVTKHGDSLYKTKLPGEAPPLTHFSNLLFSGSAFITILEVLFLGTMFLLSSDDYAFLNVNGSFSFRVLFAYFLVQSVFRRVYNTYLETCFFSFPSMRTQPDHEHKLAKENKDLNGRQQEQLRVLQTHDLITFFAVNSFELAVYFFVPGFYPPVDVSFTIREKLFRLVGNHLAMSFAMYWMHRACHSVPLFWKIHSIHHWAKHPLSRNTYEDHWLDNFMNAVVGHFCAQVLFPLDFPTFIFSHLFRIAESLEKHSGISSSLNLAHQLTVLLIPWAQMPHHHDWHHEGFKGSNFTFSSIGGVWDCMFGTRHEGRSKLISNSQTTQIDKQMMSQREAGHINKGEKNYFDTAVGSLTPVVLVVGAAFWKLYLADFDMRNFE